MKSCRTGSRRRSYTALDSIDTPYLWQRQVHLLCQPNLDEGDLSRGIPRQVPGSTGQSSRSVHVRVMVRVGQLTVNACQLLRPYRRMVKLNVLATGFPILAAT